MEDEDDRDTFYYGPLFDVAHRYETTFAPVPNTSITRFFANADLDRRKAGGFYPVFIFLGCVLVLGVLTNVLVCYIYRCRARRATSNFLVIFFAVCDLAGCLLGIPLILTKEALPYSYGVEFLCKLTGYVEACCVCSLSLTLLCAAYVCYCQLCRIGAGMCLARNCCIAALSATVLLSIPAMVVYNIKPVRAEWPDVEGRACGLDVEAPPWLFHVHHWLVLGCVALATAGMALLYGFVFISWFKQRQAQCRGDKSSPAFKQFPKKHRFVREDTSSSSVTAGSYSEEIIRLHTARAQSHTCKPHQFHHRHLHHHYHYHHNHQHTDPARVPLNSGHEGSGGGRASIGAYERPGGRGIVKSASHGMVRSTSSQQTNLLDNSSGTTAAAVTASPVVQLHVKSTKQAFISFVISVVFMVVMLPYVVVTLLIVTTDVFKRFSSTSTEIIVKLCLRSYLLNYLVKPVVYIIFNVNFREEVKQLFLKVWELCPFKATSSGTNRPSPPQSETTACSTPRTQHREMRSLSNSSIYRPAKTSV